MNNPPAFPCGEYRVPFQGMTMRDYFAARAMQTLLAAGINSEQYEEDAIEAYAIADAMLKARQPTN